MSVPKVADESEFQQLMDEIDAELKRDRVPIRARQILAIQQLSRRFGGVAISLMPSIKEPRPGIFEGEDLTLRVLNWFQERYGARLSNDNHPGYAVTIIKGDPYRIRIPWIVIGHRLLKHIALEWDEAKLGNSGKVKNKSGIRMARLRPH